mgnify:CR=1 FL=1
MKRVSAWGGAWLISARNFERIDTPPLRQKLSEQDKEIRHCMVILLRYTTITLKILRT